MGKKENTEQDIRTKEQKDVDFYKAYFWVKTWQIDWYIYTQDSNWDIEIETDNKFIPEEYIDLSKSIKG